MRVRLLGSICTRMQRMFAGRNAGAHLALAGCLTRLFALQGLRIDDSTAMYYLKESGGDLKKAVRMFGEPSL